MSEDMNEHGPLPVENIILNFLADQVWPIGNWPPGVLKNRDVLESLIDRGYVKEHIPAGGCGTVHYSIKEAGLAAIGKGAVNERPTLLARILELEAERDAANARAEKLLDELECAHATIADAEHDTRWNEDSDYTPREETGRYRRQKLIDEVKAALKTQEASHG